MTSHDMNRNIVEQSCSRGEGGGNFSEMFQPQGSLFVTDKDPLPRSLLIRDCSTTSSHDNTFKHSCHVLCQL